MVKKFIIRLLKFFVRMQLIGKIISFTYQGPGFSLNQLYASGHWRTRQNIKKEWRAIFEKLVKPALGKHFFNEFYILIFYNSRFDVDNVVGMEKIFTDTLKGTIIKDDGKVNYKGLMIFYDQTLAHNTFEFVLIEKK